MHSCIYQGVVRHERLQPIKHRFQYRNWMLYLDLEELSELRQSCRLLSDKRFSPLAFLREDHLGDCNTHLDEWVRSKVHSETGLQLHGPIRLLTQLRQWGQYFSPINLFYCWNQAQDQLIAIVAEVSNIPWGEKHVYCLWEGNRLPSADDLQFEISKEFHVSPFMGMQQKYAWSFQPPGESLLLSIRSHEGDVSQFKASLKMKRVELSSLALAWQIMRQPLPTWTIVAAIYYQAWKLWWKKCPVYAHPSSPSASRQMGA